MKHEPAADDILQSAPAALTSMAAEPERVAGSVIGGRSSHAWAWLAAAFLIVATFAAYQPVWHAGYIWDDDVMLTGNRFVQSADGLRAIWFSTELPDYFPMTSTALWLQWRLWGADPLGYHLVNVLLHALGAVVWWRVLRRLNVPGAWLAAALFALHPVNVESVAWITEIKNTLAMAFYALTALAYLKFEDSQGGRERERLGEAPLAHARSYPSGVWYAVALVCFALALLSKTAVAPFPAVLLGLAWWRRGRITSRDVWRSVPFFLLAAALAVVTVWFQQHRAIGGMAVRDDGFWSRFAGAGWAAWFYFFKALFPTNLTFVYPRWQIDATNALSYGPALLAGAVLALGWIYRDRWGKAWLLGFGYFVLLLGPVLGFVNISYMRHSFVADRWQYFAILGPLALAAAAIMTALGRFGARATMLRGVAGGLLLGTLGVLTWRQARMYENVDTLWRTTLTRNPDCPAAHTELGTNLLGQDQVDAAIESYEKALALEPGYGLAHHNYGCALLKKEDFDGAIARFQLALRHHPGFHPAQHYLGRALLQSGKVEPAISEFQKALAMQFNHAETHYHLASAWLQSGRVDSAIEHFEHAATLDPDSAQAHNDLGVALIQAGKRDEALVHFQRVLEIDPSFSAAHNNVGRVMLQMGEGKRALAHFQTALKLQPNDPDTLSNLAWVLATSPDDSVRNGTQAIMMAQRANLQASRGNPEILRALAAAYAESGRFAEAIGAVQRALNIAEQQDNAALVSLLRGDLGVYSTGAPLRDQAPATVAP